MRTIVIENGKLELRELPDLELRTLQSVVGGLIEPIFTAPSADREGYSVTGYANDEGQLIDLPPNVYCPPHPHVIAGPIVVTGLSDEGETVELTEDEMMQIGVTEGDARSPFGTAPTLHVSLMAAS